MRPEWPIITPGWRRLATLGLLDIGLSAAASIPKFSQNGF